MKTVEIHHFFTHDMRWIDNTAITRAILHAESLYEDLDKMILKGWICLDPIQLSKIPKKPDPDTLEYRGVPAAITFLSACESLLASKDALGSIQVTTDSIQTVSKRLTKKTRQNYIISCARQYTPFAHKRQCALQRDWGDQFVCFDDHSLLSPNQLRKTADKEQYLVFRYFYDVAKTFRSEWNPKKTVPSRSKLIVPSNPKHRKTALVRAYLHSLCKYWSPNKVLPTNRAVGLRMLRSLSKQWKSNTYKQIRNDIQQPTSMLARFLNSGVISIRRVWKTLGKRMPAFERQLVWRSFYACRMNAIRCSKWKPQESLTINEYDSPTWNSIKKGTHWKQWTEGKTGVPLVDASMRYLRKHGWLHNRLRMIVASYLTRILRISWRHGESWFAQLLFDYDATQNHFGWKGQASLSRDSSKYFRIPNPWLTKYDPNATFIKENISELKNVDPNTIQSWETKHSQHPNISYPAPIISDHTSEAKQSIADWKPLYSSS